MVGSYIGDDACTAYRLRDTAESAVKGDIQDSGVSLSLKKGVELFDKCVCIGSVNLACIRNRLASRSGAAEAMHTDIKEELMRN